MGREVNWPWSVKRHTMPLSCVAYSVASARTLPHGGPAACLSACLSACLTVCLSACLSACPSACLTVCLSACPPACLTVCLSACPPACLAACLPVGLFIHIFKLYHTHTHFAKMMADLWETALEHEVKKSKKYPNISHALDALGGDI